MIPDLIYKIEEFRFRKAALIEKKISNYKNLLYNFLEDVFNFSLKKYSLLAALCLTALFFQMASFSKYLGPESSYYLNEASSNIISKDQFLNKNIFNFISFLIIYFSEFFNTKISISTKIIFHIEAILFIIIINLISLSSHNKSKTLPGYLIKLPTSITPERQFIFNKNILIILFAFVFYFRIFSLQNFEYHTPESQVFGLVFLYIFIRITPNNVDKYIAPILSISIIIIDKNFFIVSLFFLFFQKKLVEIIPIIFFLITKEQSSDAIFLQEKTISFFEFIKNDISIFIIFCAINYKIILKNKTLSNLIFCITALMLFILYDNKITIHERSLITSIFFIFCILIFTELLANKSINFQKNWFLILTIFIFSQLDGNLFAKIISFIPYMWLLLMINDKLFSLSENKKYFLEKSYALKLSLIVIFIYLNKYPELQYLLSLSIFCLILKRSHHKIFNKEKKLKNSFVAINFTFLFYLLHLLINSISGKGFDISKQILPKTSVLKKQIEIINNNISDSEKILILSSNKNIVQPTLLYTNHSNLVAEKEIAGIYKIIQSKNYSVNEELKKIFEKIKNNQPSIIFVERDIVDKNSCTLNIFNLINQNTQYKKFLKNNYCLSNTISETTKIDIPFDFLDRNINEFENKILYKEENYTDIYFRCSKMGNKGNFNNSK